MLRHFVNLLQSAVAQPDLRLGALAMLSPEEVEQQKTVKKMRKQSQLKKLKTTAPEGVGLSREEIEKHQP